MSETHALQDVERWRRPTPGQTRIIWEDDEPPPRRPAGPRAVAAHVTAALPAAPTANERQARREALADALAQCLWEELRRTVTTPGGNGRSASTANDPMEGADLLEGPGQ